MGTAKTLLSHVLPAWYGGTNRARLEPGETGLAMCSKGHLLCPTIGFARRFGLDLENLPFTESYNVRERSKPTHRPSVPRQARHSIVRWLHEPSQSGGLLTVSQCISVGAVRSCNSLSSEKLISDDHFEASRNLRQHHTRSSLVCPCIQSFLSQGLGLLY